MSTLRVAATLLASTMLIFGPCASAQPVAPTEPQPAAASPSPAVTAPAPPTLTRLREGTEVDLTLDDALSSKTSAEGDKFSVTTSEPIKLGDGSVIPAGFHGRGDVSSVERNGMMGKPGQLSVRLDYVMIGDTKVHLRANKSQEGKSNQTNVVVLSLLITPLFLLMHGKEATIPKGATLVGYVDSDVDLPTPIAAPPPRN